MGKQEQIDISKTLGVSFASSKDFIEQLQALSVSTNLQKDLSSILGFSGYEYDLNKASQITTLSQYLNPNVATTLDAIKSQSATNIQIRTEQEAFAAAALKFNQELASYESELNNRINSMSSLQEAYDYWKRKDEGDGEGKKYKPAKDAARASINENNAAISRLQNLIPALYSEKALKGYFTGGYTGDIPINAIAGFVHGGEHVLDSSVTSQINSIGSVADMVNQYTNTNFYQKMNNTFIEMKKEISNLVKITIDQANEIKKIRKETEFKGAI